MNNNMKKPSVTELLKLLDKPALLKWANKQGLNGIDISVKKKEWLDEGISIHSQIENHIKFGENFFNPEHQRNFKKFISDKQILGIEKSIETEWFQGRYDAKLLINGLEYIIDYKNNFKMAYLEHKLQLVAYGMAENCNNLAIVSVPDFKLIEIPIINIEPYQNILKSLYDIWYNKKLLDGIQL